MEPGIPSGAVPIFKEPSGPGDRWQDTVKRSAARWSHHFRGNPVPVVSVRTGAFSFWGSISGHPAGDRVTNASYRAGITFLDVGPMGSVPSVRQREPSERFHASPSRCSPRELGPGRKWTGKRSDFCSDSHLSVTWWNSSTRVKYVSPMCSVSGRRVSNPLPSAWKADALPNELLPRSCAVNQIPALEFHERFRFSERFILEPCRILSTEAALWLSPCEAVSVVMPVK